jgi:hypothetical protein
MFFVTSYAGHRGIVRFVADAATAPRRRLGADGLAGPAISARRFFGSFVPAISSYNIELLGAEVGSNSSPSAPHPHESCAEQILLVNPIAKIAADCFLLENPGHLGTELRTAAGCLRDPTAYRRINGV